MTQPRTPRTRPGTLPFLLAAALSLPLAAPAAAQPAATPTKVSSRTCGAYTLTLRENGFEDPADRVTITRGATSYATVEDTMVSVDWCRDMTGDGVPEVLLAGFSGGAHCCFTHTLYSLTSPPRRLLTAFSAHSSGLDVRQLDGRGPLELVGADWRFAYGYGMSFAESAPLPVVYSFLNGQYVENTRAFPGFIQTYARGMNADPFSGGVLVEYATRTVTQGAASADTWAAAQPAPFRAWLANYGPDIRQDLSDFGLRDWPTRAGLNADGARSGIGGAFTAPGTRAYLAVTQEPGVTGAATLRLFQPRGADITAGPTLLTVPVTRDTYGQPTLTVWPAVTVRRAGGRDDTLLRDARSGSVRYAAYRVGSAALTELRDDPLAATAALLSDLSSVAGHVASQYRDVTRTAAQTAEVQRRIDTAVTRARPWLGTRRGPTEFPLGRLGNFTFGSVTLTQDSPAQAQAVITTTVGFTDDRTDSEYVSGERHTLTVNLDRAATGWQVTDWTLTPRTGELYEE